MNFESTMLEEDDSPSAKPYYLVLICGLVTTALTLGGVYWLTKNIDGFHIMGWYVYFVLPVGAMIVGVMAASGYAIASWLTGIRISKGLLFVVLLFQAAAYVAAEYVEYRDVINTWKQDGLLEGPEPSFAEYYDFKARNITLEQRGGGNQQEKPLGAWGYVFVLLGAAGFIFSGLIAPAVLYSVPYCEGCQRYMKTNLLGILPARVSDADEVLARLRAAIAEGNPEAVRQELRDAGADKANDKLPKRMHLSLVWCKSCQEGRVLFELVTGSGQETTKTKLAEDPVPSAFVSGMLAKKSKSA